MKESSRKDRFEWNSEERLFFEAWQEINKDNEVIGYLLSCLSENKEKIRIENFVSIIATEHDEELVAMTIQWLGSPVGRGFLRELGYVKENKK